MANVASGINAKISADSAWSRVERVGGTEHGAASLYDALSLPDHADDGAGQHVCRFGRCYLANYRVLTLTIKPGIYTNIGSIR